MSLLVEGGGGAYIRIVAGQCHMSVLPASGRQTKEVSHQSSSRAVSHVSVDGRWKGNRGRLTSE